MKIFFCILSFYLSINISLILANSSASCVIHKKPLFHLHPIELKPCSVDQMDSSISTVLTESEIQEKDDTFHQRFCSVKYRDENGNDTYFVHPVSKDTLDESQELEYLIIDSVIQVNSEVKPEVNSSIYVEIQLSKRRHQSEKEEEEELVDEIAIEFSRAQSQRDDQQYVKLIASFYEYQLNQSENNHLQTLLHTESYAFFIFDSRLHDTLPASVSRVYIVRGHLLIPELGKGLLPPSGSGVKLRLSMATTKISIRSEQNQPEFLIKQIEINHCFCNETTEENQKPFQINCANQSLQFSQELNQCILKEANKCNQSDQIESISLRACVDKCQRDEYIHFIGQGYSFCLPIHTICLNIVGCSTCDHLQSRCFTCEEGYTLGESNSVCKAVPVLPSIIDSNSRQLSVQYGCSRPICLECLNSTQCAKCQYPFVSVQGSCVLCGRGTERSSELDDAYCKKTLHSQGCSNYNYATYTCEGCFEGFVLSYGCRNNVRCNTAGEIDLIDGISCGACSTLIPHCTSCASDTQCMVCDIGYVLDVQDISVLNPVFVCASSCSVGYFVDFDNQCAPCGLNCDSCTRGSLACDNCASGHFVDVAYRTANPNLRERCVQPAGVTCSVNCDTCNSTSCLTCMTGYALVGGVCEKCGEGCLVCLSSTICTQCVGGETNLAVCPDVECLMENQYVSEGQVCAACVDNCLSCKNGIACDACYPGYVLEKNSCNECPSDCAMCYDVNLCRSCNHGFNVNWSGGCEYNAYFANCQSNEFAVGNVCYGCSDACDQCSEANYCTVCKNGKTPKNGLCVTCETNSSKYVSEEHTCEDCGSSCSSCTDFFGCTACNSGYFYVASSKNCVEVSLCGDGNLDLPIVVNSNQLLVKQCDDRNNADSDGCSATCQLENGFKCTYDSNARKSTCAKNAGEDNSGTDSDSDSNSNRFWLRSKINRQSINPVIVIQFHTGIRKAGNLRLLGIVDDSEMSNYIRDSIEIVISDISSEEYTYAIQMNGENYKIYELEFQSRVDIVEKTITVRFSAAFISVNEISNSSAEIDFPTTKPISSQDKDVADAVSTVAQYAGTTFVVSIIPVILLSNFSLLFNALDLFQMIFYLQYVNIRLPYNILKFLYIMTNFQLPLSLNFIAWLLDENPVESPIVPKPFEDGEVSGVFLENTGDSYSQIIILGVSHLILVGFTKVCRKSTSDSIKKSGAFIEGKLKSSWEFGWYLDMYWEMYLSFVVGCMLQFYAVTFDDIQSTINSVVFLFSLIVTILSPCVFFGIIRKNQSKLEEIEIKDKWGMLYETLRVVNHINKRVFPEIRVYPSIHIKGADQEIKSLQSLQIQSYKLDQFDEIYQATKEPVISNVSDQSETGKHEKQIESRSSRHVSSSEQHQTSKSASVLSKYFFVALYLRKLFFGIVLVGLWDHPYIQLIILDFLNVVIVAYLVFAKPYENQLHTFKGIVCEIFMIIAQISFKFLLINDDDNVDSDESDRVRIGWIFIVCCAGILTVQMIFIFANLVSDIHTQIKLCRKNKNQPVDVASDAEEEGEKPHASVPVIKSIEVEEEISAKNNNNSNILNSHATTHNHQQHTHQLKTSDRLRNDVADDFDLHSNRGLFISTNRLQITKIEPTESIKPSEFGSEITILSSKKKLESPLSTLPLRQRKILFIPQKNSS